MLAVSWKLPPPACMTTSAPLSQALCGDCRCRGCSSAGPRATSSASDTLQQLTLLKTAPPEEEDEDDDDADEDNFELPELGRLQRLTRLHIGVTSNQQISRALTHHRCSDVPKPQGNQACALHNMWAFSAALPAGSCAMLLHRTAIPNGTAYGPALIVWSPQELVLQKRDEHRAVGMPVRPDSPHPCWRRLALQRRRCSAAPGLPHVCAVAAGSGHADPAKILPMAEILARISKGSCLYDAGAHIGSSIARLTAFQQASLSGPSRTPYHPCGAASQDGLQCHLQPLKQLRQLQIHGVGQRHGGVQGVCGDAGICHILIGWDAAPAVLAEYENSCHVSAVAWGYLPW